MRRAHCEMTEACLRKPVVTAHPGLQVTGANLVTMTNQKQNLVIAVLADLLAFAAVWQIRCISVNQNSPMAGQDISSAVIAFVVQQDADALFVGQVCSSLFLDFPPGLMNL